MANAQRFQHQPLHGPRNFRLMLLEPARNLSAPLHCRLNEVGLDENPQYECLSYSCDKQNGVSTILIHNLPSEITKNCEAALRRLRYEDHPRAIWVDSICINQGRSDAALTERSQQILLMREIYQKAVEVQVWLGEVNNMTSRGWMMSMAKEKLEPWKLKGESKNDQVKFDVPKAGLTFIAESIAFIIIEVIKLASKPCARVSTSKKRSLIREQNPQFRFFASTVFERMWCVQEVVVGHNVRLMQGSSTLKWEQLVKKVGELAQVGMMGTEAMYDQYAQRYALQEKLRSVINPQPNQIASKWPPLSSLLDTTRYLGSEYPHDKVYSLYGVFQMMGIRLQPPDYKKPVRLVYQEIVLASFSCDRNLDVLYQVTSVPNDHNLQSWVPDLSNTKAPPTPSFGAYHASGNSPLQWQLSSDQSELWLSGKVIDRVKLCSDALRSPNESASQQNGPLASDGETHVAFETFKKWLNMASALDHYPTGQSTIDAFGLTLITNNAVRLDKRLQPFVNVYKSWYEILTKSSSGELLLEKGVDNMVDDIAALPIDAHQKQEFALHLVSAHMVAVFLSPVTSGKKVRAFHHWLHMSLRRMVFFITERGYMGLAPASVQVGDDVVLLSGMKTPFLRRNAPVNGSSQLVAPVYIEGMMEGELWNQNEHLDKFAFI